jgi:hypothetical protein
MHNAGRSCPGFRGPIPGPGGGRLDADAVLCTTGLELAVVPENRVDRAGIPQPDRGRPMDGVESPDLNRLQGKFPIGLQILIGGPAGVGLGCGEDFVHDGEHPIAPCFARRDAPHDDLVAIELFTIDAVGPTDRTALRVSTRSFSAPDDHDNARFACQGTGASTPIPWC